MLPNRRSDMTPRRPITFLASAAAIPLVALAVAACGGGGVATAASPPKTSSGATATVGTANSSLGSILVNSTPRIRLGRQFWLEPHLLAHARPITTQRISREQT